GITLTSSDEKAFERAFCARLGGPAVALSSGTTAPTRSWCSFGLVVANVTAIDHGGVNAHAKFPPRDRNVHCVSVRCGRPTNAECGASCSSAHRDPAARARRFAPVNPGVFGGCNASAGLQRLVGPDGRAGHLRHRE